MESQEERSSSFKVGLAIAVIAATVGGVFTLVPVIYDVYKGRSEVSTSILRSEVLGDNPEKQIVIAEVENTGRQTLQNLVIYFEIPEATFSDVLISVPKGVDFRSSENDELRVEVETLNAGEIAKISFLVQATELPEGNVLSVRASDLPLSAVRAKSDQSDFEKLLHDRPVLLFFLTSLYGATVLGLGRFIFRRFSRLRRMIDSRNDFEREDALLFVGKLYLSKDQRDDIFSGQTYRSAADSIFLACLKKEIEPSFGAKLLLSLFVAGPNMNESSKNLIRAYLVEKFGVAEDIINEFCNDQGGDIRSRLVKLRCHSDIGIKFLDEIPDLRARLERPSRQKAQG